MAYVPLTLNKYYNTGRERGSYLLSLDINLVLSLVQQVYVGGGILSPSFSGVLDEYFSPDTFTKFGYKKYYGFLYKF